MAKEHVHGVFESIAGGYDAANDRISLGMHNAWKKALCKTAVKACDTSKRAGLILDVCCGTGDIEESVARDNPDIFIVGLDFSANMLDVARTRLQGLDNVALIEGNAMALPFDDATFDSAVISFGLRNTPDYEKVVSEMVRVVRPGGTVACLDASVPSNKAVAPFYQFYYKNIMTLLGGGIAHHKEYEWLYQSTQEFLRKDELARLFEQCGLTHVQVRSFMFGAAALHIGMVPLFGDIVTSAVQSAIQMVAQSQDATQDDAAAAQSQDAPQEGAAAVRSQDAPQEGTEV